MDRRAIGDSSGEAERVEGGRAGEVAGMRNSLTADPAPGEHLERQAP
jgi:hypothetical protein